MAREIHAADTAIARAVEVALRYDDQIPEGLTVEVAGGHVTLGGELNWEWERREAERVVGAVPGVRGVTNLIRLHPAPPEALPPPHHRLRSRENGWVALEDTREKCELYFRGLILITSEAPTAPLREHARSLARDLVLERWDLDQTRWVPERDPVIERLKDEQGLTG
ncbi:MAG TPA: BON domain-containing protein [Candidatus Dormibacteraeota bacterium]